MLDSVPVPLQAILWPLLGAAFILVTWRFLPNWLRRMAALAAALASLMTLHSLATGAAPLALQAAQGVEAFWEPVNLFRLSPTLRPDGLSLLMGFTLAGTTAAAVLGIRGSDPKQTVWHALILVTLAGFLILSMAANLLTLALGSALLDLSLIAMAISEPGKIPQRESEPMPGEPDRVGPDRGRIAWRMAVPGAISTVVIVLSALQMSAETGTASLLARNLTLLPLALLSVAGMLRLLVYPLHPRGLRTPESGFTFLVLANAGLFLVIRARAAAPALSEPGWMFAIGLVALLAGSLLAWTGTLGSVTGQGKEPDEGTGETQPQRTIGAARGWLGVTVSQAGYALAFLLLVSASRPWPVISMTVAMTILAIWWDGTTRRSNNSSNSRFKEWRATAEDYVVQRLPAAEEWRGLWIVRHAAALLPACALASLAGFPLTIGALGRWSFYAALLHNRQAALLITVLVADTLLAAALWIALGGLLKAATGQRPGAAALLALVVLAVAVITIGVAPGVLGLERAETAEVSVFSLGILYVLPWLAGGWLGRFGARAGRYSTTIYRVVALDWLYHAANWAGQQLVTAIHWLSRVGEGEGWWGWALIILALGGMLLIIR